MAINREHKDRLFSFIFGNGNHKEWTLSLYNAVSGASYAQPEDIQITTIDDVIYMGMKNDVSFIISGMLNIYEQQSTYNPNMPIRMLMYAGRLYDKHIHAARKNIYSSSLVCLPIPRLVVFYNGMEKQGDTVLRLSDSFVEESRTIQDNSNEPDIEVKVRMININYGHNGELLEKCRPLAEYAWLIDRIRKNGINMNIEDAVDQAIDEMPDSYLIRKYLLENRAEVKNMCITEYNEAETMQMFIEEGRKEGRKEGEDRFGKLVALLLSNGMTEEEKKAAADKDARAELYRKYGI